jgi:hypothetical protein
MAALAEILMRQVNVAVPEVDEGEDVFAFHSGEPEVTRLQVKTANAEALKEEGRYAARVSVPLAQLRTKERVRLYYLFAVRLADRWTDFVIISHLDLDDLSRTEGVGYANQKAGELQLHLSFGPTSLVCSAHDLQSYRNAWNHLPVFLRSTNEQHPAGPAQPEGPASPPSAG